MRTSETPGAIPSRRTTPRGTRTARSGVTFVLFQNAKAGTGTEVAVLNHIRFAPDFMVADLSLVQGASFDFGRADVDGILSRLPQGHVLTVAGTPSSAGHQFISRNKLLSMLFYEFLFPAYFRLSGAARRYRAAINKISPRIVYLVGNDLAPFCAAEGITVVGSTHGWNPRAEDGLLSRLQLALLRAGLLYPSVDAFHVFPGSEVPENLPVGTPHFTCPNGVDCSTFNPNPSHRMGNPRFLFVGRLEGCKGIRAVVEAWAGIESVADRATLEIVGSGPLTSWLQQSVSPGLTVRGVVGFNELISTYRRSDVLLFPSTCDVFPFVILEALASGLYVVASDALKGRFDEFESAGALEYCHPIASQLRKRVIALMDRSNPVHLRDREAQSRMVRDLYGVESTTNRFFSGLESLIRAPDPAAESGSRAT